MVAIRRSWKCKFSPWNYPANLQQVISGESERRPWPTVSHGRWATGISARNTSGTLQNVNPTNNPDFSTRGIGYERFRPASSGVSHSRIVYILSAYISKSTRIFLSMPPSNQEQLTTSKGWGKISHLGIPMWSGNSRLTNVMSCPGTQAKWHQVSHTNFFEMRKKTSLVRRHQVSRLMKRMWLLVLSSRSSTGGLTSYPSQGFDPRLLTPNDRGASQYKK